MAQDLGDGFQVGGCAQGVARKGVSEVVGSQAPGDAGFALGGLPAGLE